MKNASKPDHVSLANLLQRIGQGQYLIPDFQRDFEWMPWDIRDLMRSIFLDYYIGSLLLWKGSKENFAALDCQPVYGYDRGSQNGQYIVLDGQQRLTAMHYAFFAPDVPPPNRSIRCYFFIQVDKFTDELYDEAFTYDWLSQRYRKLLANIDEQYEQHTFPLAILGKDLFTVANWLQGYQDFWQRRAKEAETAGDQSVLIAATNHAEGASEFKQSVQDTLTQFQVSYNELDKDLEIDRVCDIFTQLNSKGVRLDIFDLINALVRPKGVKLKESWHEAEPRLDFVDSRRLNVYVLQVMSLLVQGYCSPKYLYYLMPGQQKKIRLSDGTFDSVVLVPSPEAFDRLWRRAVDSLEGSINVLQHPQEYGAIHAKFVPYDSILPGFASLRAHVALLPSAERLAAYRKVRHWYWASVFLNRYSGSVETTTAKDFLDMKTWISDDDAEPALIQEFAQRYQSFDLRGEQNTQTATYKGVFNLLVIQGAKDWITGAAPMHDDLDDHHIVPASWGKSNLGPKSTPIHSILNRTPISADTNRNVIRDRLPNQYLPEWIEKSGEHVVRAVLESHFISPASLDILLRVPFSPDDFEEFVLERNRTIQMAMQDLLIKERLDLPPDLRLLDEQIEQIELSLRALIIEALGSNVGQLPSHVLPKMRDRVDRALKKNPALDPVHMNTMAGHLEYADLRELEQVIVSALHWPLFQTWFPNKEQVAARFNQLAEARNAIRHSRMLDEATRLDGQAAVSWFRAAIRRPDAYGVK